MFRANSYLTRCVLLSLTSVASQASCIPSASGINKAIHGQCYNIIMAHMFYNVMRMPCTIDWHCVVECVHVIEASRSAVLACYRNQESIYLVHLRVNDRGIESELCTHHNFGHIDDLYPYFLYTWMW